MKNLYLPLGMGFLSLFLLTLFFCLGRIVRRNLFVNSIDTLVEHYKVNTYHGIKHNYLKSKNKGYIIHVFSLKTKGLSVVNGFLVPNNIIKASYCLEMRIRWDSDLEIISFNNYNTWVEDEGVIISPNYRKNNRYDHLLKIMKAEFSKLILS